MITASSDDRIAAVDARTCSYRITPPLEIGGRTITHREYAVARVMTGCGLTGNAYLYSEEPHLDDLITEHLSPKLIGRCVSQLSPTLFDTDAPSAPVAAGSEIALRRAGSLIDLCLWDL